MCMCVRIAPGPLCHVEHDTSRPIVRRVGSVDERTPSPPLHTQDNWGLVTRSAAGKTAKQAAAATVELSQNVEETLQLTDKIKEVSKAAVAEVKKKL